MQTESIRGVGGAGEAPILVTGATGHVGSELLQQLVARGCSVRAMTRRPEQLSTGELVSVVRGDLADPESLARAVAGVESVFAMSAQAIGSADAPTHDIALAEACRRAGVRRIVKLSALAGGGQHAGGPIARWVRAAEAAVIESGCEWTLLRPGRFMSNTLGWAGMIRQSGEVSIPLAHRVTASIDPADVAAVAVCALLEGRFAGQALELSGPEALAPADELAVLSQLLGRPLRLNALTNEAARAAMLRYGMPEPVVDAILADAEGTFGSEVLPTVAEVTGRPARRFAEWAEAHRAAFA